jgi:hypothetical protein
LPVLRHIFSFDQQLSDVKGNGIDGKVNSNKVFTEVPEAEVLVVGFALPKHRFGFDRSTAAVVKTFFGTQKLSDFFFVTVKVGINFYSSIPFCIVT